MSTEEARCTTPGADRGPWGSPEAAGRGPRWLLSLNKTGTRSGKPQLETTALLGISWRQPLSSGSTIRAAEIDSSVRGRGLPSVRHARTQKKEPRQKKEPASTILFESDFYKTCQTAGEHCVYQKSPPSGRERPGAFGARHFRFLFVRFLFPGGLPSVRHARARGPTNQFRPP